MTTPVRRTLTVLSRRAQEELNSLQSRLHAARAQRAEALRMLISSRSAATKTAQMEFWLEFACADQEYRVVLRRLAHFCHEHRDGSPRSGAA